MIDVTPLFIVIVSSIFIIDMIFTIKNISRSLERIVEKLNDISSLLEDKRKL